jgi:hypothetical protein
MASVRGLRKKRSYESARNETGPLIDQFDQSPSARRGDLPVCVNVADE